jgi:DNA-binding PadR family transcriptional regulator
MAKRKRKLALTTPDLVLLSLLSERSMHGYQANLELERRQVRDWAGVSRPQVYYSLEKLERLGLLRAAKSNEPAAGPERTVFAVTAAGQAALADALERPDWVIHRDRPPFLTWIALSWQARRAVFEKHIQRRRAFLKSELDRQETTLESVLKEVGHRHHEAVWMLTFTIDHIKLELAWLDHLERELPRRASARHPEYFGNGS